jgi:hypothetical protein
MCTGFHIGNLARVLLGFQPMDTEEILKWACGSSFENHTVIAQIKPVLH